MTAFTTEELEYAANMALDFYLKGKPLWQNVQDKPLLSSLRRGQKKFPGGKEFVNLGVKGNPNRYFQGFTGTDVVAYTNPSNAARVKFPWKEMHAGITVDMTTLKKDGISVVDTDGKKTSEHSGRDITVLSNMFEDKLDDMDEGMARDMNETLWGDGTADPKAPAGILSFLTTTPSVGTCGGLDRAVNSWWRHDYLAGIDGSTTGNIVTTLTARLRQLRRFGGNPRLWLAGSSWLGAMEGQLYAKGYFSMAGFSKGTNDMGLSEITFNGQKITYDPTLDDMGLEKSLFVIDTSKLGLYVMDGEDMKQHNPARPVDVYSIYRGVTWTGVMCARQLNCHGRYSIA